ncbi:MAG: RNA 2',3'-cyclic phosphodiesterase [Desulfobacteraceae bacterium]|nr:RNA 2',3'-cyclic phosphodiesterase [Desulfobacteraceae bacterium]
MPRLFVAIEVPEPIRRAVAALEQGLAGARWLPASQLHLTLCFIGEVDTAQGAAIESGLPEGISAPFTCRLTGIGCFPSPARPRVLHVRVESGPGLYRLRTALVARLGELGQEVKPDRFTPHLTLARFRNGQPEAVRDYLSRQASFRQPPFTVNAYHLYASRLTPQGAIHTRLRSYRLTA